MKVKRYQSLILLVGAVACFLIFYLKFRYHFFFVERSRLFLMSPDFLAEYFAKPAWLACMAGDFFQQLYHYNVLGPATLALAILALGLASLRAFSTLFPGAKGKFLRHWVPVVLALAVMAVEARLYVYENARLASLMALLGGFLMWNLYHPISAAVRTRTGKWSHLANFPLIALLTIGCWWLFGYGFVVLLILDFICALSDRRFSAESLAALALCNCLVFAVATEARLDRKEAVLYPGVGSWVDVQKEQGVELLLAYDTEYNRGNFLDVIKMFEKAKYQKVQEMGFFYAMSASQYGILPDKLRNIKDPMIGPFVHVGEKSSLFLIEMMSEFYYLIGDMTYAERICMHANSFSPSKLSPRMLQSLVRINLVTGDDEAALKYVRILEKSPVYHRWAKDHTPGALSTEVAQEVEAKRPFINNHDVIHVGDNCHTILTGLLDSNKDNVIALDYMLCSDFMAGEKEMFKSDYNKYGPRDKELYNRLLKTLR